MVKDSSHVLIGIVSTRLGESCDDQDHAVFTSVAALRPWIEDSITENGGMASCGFTLSAPPTLGFRSSDIVLFFYSLIYYKEYLQENHWSLLQHLDFLYLVVNPKRSKSPLLKPLALKVAPFPRCLRRVTASELS